LTGWAFLQLGPSGLLFGMVLLATVTFYMAHWQTYVTGSLSVQKLDVTETQFVLMSIHVITALVGPEFWVTPVVSGLVLREVLMYLWCVRVGVREFLFILFSSLYQPVLVPVRQCPWLPSCAISR
jgi:hypothetical protein